jgi:hypothetical protein
MKINLKNKWRLPTVEEFENVLYPNMEKIPNLEKYSPYWSSSEYSSYSAWSFSFSNGRAGNYGYKRFTKQVRPVRDFSSDLTNSPNTTIIGNLEIYNEDLDNMSWDDAVDAVDKLNYNKKFQNENKTSKQVAIANSRGI